MTEFFEVMPDVCVSPAWNLLDFIPTAQNFEVATRVLEDLCTSNYVECQNPNYVAPVSIPPHKYARPPCC